MKCFVLNILLIRGKLRGWFNSGHFFDLFLLNAFGLLLLNLTYVHDVEAIYGPC